jgi:hypothetical protein
MQVLGTPTTDWQARLREVGVELLDAIVRVWPQCVQHIQPDELGHEDRITKRLFLELMEDLLIREAPFRIGYQHSLVAWDPDRKPIDVGRIDLAAYFNTHPDIYYGCEAKRLHVPTGVANKRRSGAADYVKAGVNRYSTGQYSSGVHLASMLGYVLDGKVIDAENSIARTLRVRAVQVGCTTNPPVVFATGRGTSVHRRLPGTEIQVEHLLLPL